MPKVVDHEQRRREITSAALMVVSEHGLVGSTMRRIAEAAGCTTGRLTHYFPSRAAILEGVTREVFDAIRERLGTAMAATDDPVQQLRLLLHEVLPLDETRRREALVASAFRAETMVPADNHPWFKESFESFRQVLADYLGATDINVRVDDLNVYLDGLSVRGLLEPEDFPPRRLIAMLDRYLGITTPAEMRS